MMRGHRNTHEEMEMKTHAIPQPHGRAGGARLAAAICLAAALLVAASQARASGADAKAAAAAPNQITAIEVAKEGRVVIRGSARPTFTVFKLAEPARVVIDVASADVTAVASPIQVHAGGIAGVTTAQFDEGGRRVGRVVVALDSDARYDVAARGNDLVVTVGPAPVQAASKTALLQPTPGKVAPVAKPAPRSSDKAEAPADPNVIVSRTEARELVNPAKSLDGVSTRSEAGQAVVEIRTAGAVGTYSLIELKSPARLALDLPGVSASRKSFKAAGAGPVKGVRVAVHDRGVRVVVDGKGDTLPIYEIERVANGLSVRVGQKAVAQAAPKAPARSVTAAKAPPQAEAVAKAPPQAQAVAKTPAKAEVLTKIEAAPAPKKTPAAPAKLASVKAVDLVSDGGAMKVVVSIDGEVPYSLSRIDATTQVITIKGARLPERLERNVDASALGGPVSMLSSYNVPGVKDEVKIVATTALPTSGDAKLVAGKLTWTFRGSQPIAQAAQPAARAGVYASEAKAAASSAAAMSERNYTGRRVDFNVQNMDIKNLISAIAEIARRNIIVADDVSGRVTIKLRNVPWDQALDTILRSKGLGREEIGNIIRVAPLATLRAEAKEAADHAKIERQLEPVKVRLIGVNYAKASQLTDKLKDTLSERGTVSVDERTNTLIVKDVQDALARAEGIVRNLDTATPEVLIESRIVEASTSFSRSVGIQWGGNVSFAPAFGNPTGLIFPNILQVAGAADDPGAPLAGLNGVTQPNFAVNMPTAIGLNNGAGLGFVFGSAGGAANLNLRLSAAENSGTIKTISSPRVVTLDNIEASVGQGVQIPYSQISAAGVNTTFVEAKLELRVTPHVTQEGGIQMKIAATNNQPNPGLTGSNGQPSITRREAKTEVLVRDGDTTVIGGIYTRRNSEAWNEVPVLSRIPVIGWLFKKKTVTDDRTELLIFITPRIVNRSASVAAAQSAVDSADKQ